MAKNRTVKVSFIAAQLINLIKVYRFLISSLLGECCRFEPTCSLYAIQALRMHGGIRGTWLLLRRVVRCHPWQQGGVDPVPLKNKLREAKRC